MNIKKKAFARFQLKGQKVCLWAAPLILAIACQTSSTESQHAAEPEIIVREEMVAFEPFDQNPVFSGTGADTWDQAIRERGYILHEEDGYHLWYTGFRADVQDPSMALGYATSPDGIHWTRYRDNPVFNESWVEDMMVVKWKNLYYMFAEGKNDIAHMLTSSDKVHWKDHGPLRILYTNGQPLSEGPYGTPTVYVRDSLWYLFYERNDDAIWLASSRDLTEWLNVKDEPVITKGPEPYDTFGVAMNQVVAYKGLYYAYYHGTAFKDWSRWSTNVAVSKNLIDWQKYILNPILEDNKSSAILVEDSTGFRMYSMHPDVHLHFPKSAVAK